MQQRRPQSKRPGADSHLNPTMLRSLLLIALVSGLFAGSFPAQAQDAGPMPPPPTYKLNRIPSVPQPAPPPIRVSEIIQKFTANEDIAKRIYDQYDFTETIRVEELADGGGKFTASGEVYTRPDGARYLRISKPPISNLKFTSYTLEDVRTIVAFPQLFLTTDESGYYEFLYVGQDKLDELNTYVFQVKPKMLSRSRRFFQGVIYVDDHDLAIVETYGKFVSELADAEGTRLPFSMFETYRENFQGKYWLPTYVSSDDYVKNSDQDELHLRLVVRSSDFKLHSDALSTPSSDSPAAQPANGPQLK
jgi:hypothetical protein